MTRLQHVHALVRQAAVHRKPGPHGPAFRVTALVSGLAIATTILITAPARASAAVPAARPEPLPRRASPAPGPSLRAVLTAAFVPNQRPASIGRFAGPEQDLPRPKPDHEPATLLQNTAPRDVPPQNAASPGVPPQDATLPGTAFPGSGPAGAASQGAAPRDPAPQQAPAQGTAPENAAAPAGIARPDAAALNIPESRRLEQQFVEDILRGNGIRWTSTGGCSDRNVTTCTSFENIRWGTIKGLIGFAESSGCEITVTGGTERGHASGPRSHWNGYKADIAPGRCVDRAIKRHPFAGVRGDGAELYRSSDGVLFAREKDHWDITFR
ncbi:hypothetical protein [Spirillospora sp. NPDC048819]|uniref:hypothetical protein n=1 Tax=Spirillospora sp. NPDC048819 TaxID=3155268 RepID=UPI0033CF2073